MKSKDLYNWGNNCKLLKMHSGEVADMLYEYQLTLEQCDDFFEGFVNGVNEEIVAIPLTY